MHALLSFEIDREFLLTKVSESADQSSLNGAVLSVSAEQISKDFIIAHTTMMGTRME